MEAAASLASTEWEDLGGCCPLPSAPSSACPSAVRGAFYPLLAPSSHWSPGPPLPSSQGCPAHCPRPRHVLTQPLVVLFLAGPRLTPGCRHLVQCPVQCRGLVLFYATQYTNLSAKEKNGFCGQISLGNTALDVPLSDLQCMSAYSRFQEVLQ